MLVRGLVVAGGAAGLAVEEAVGAEPDIHHRLAEAAEFFALTRTFRLFALRAFVFGGPGSVAHEATVTQESGDRNVTEVIGEQGLEARDQGPDI